MCSEFYSRSLAGRGPGLCIPPTVNICNRFLASGQKLLSVSGCRSLAANAGSGQINNKAVPSSPALLISVLGGCIPALLLITPAWVLTDVPASPRTLFSLPPSRRHTTSNICKRQTFIYDSERVFHFNVNTKSKLTFLIHVPSLMVINSSVHVILKKKGGDFGQSFIKMHSCAYSGHAGFRTMLTNSQIAI